MEQEHQYTTNPPLEYQSEKGRLNILGFWIFLGAEIALFSTLFATYFVLMHRTADGPLPSEMFQVQGILVMTFLLLTSSFTCGLAIHEMRRSNPRGLFIWLIVTLLLGAGFLFFEVREFVEYTHEGVALSTSAFWSAFFVLTGTHGVHVALGLGWIILILIQLKKRGLTPITSSKVFISSLYWHFLDVIWIFIFTGVYLTGMVVHHG